VRAYIENRLKNKAVIWGLGGGCSGFSYGFTFDDKQKEGERTFLTSPISSSIFKTSSLAPPCKEPAKVPTAADTEANGLASQDPNSAYTQSALTKGKIDAGESPLEAANRELIEEIGYGAKKRATRIFVNHQYCIII
jgi:hypothetical protein